MIHTPYESKGPVVEWDARAYHDKSRPHVAWGATVLERLSLRGDEIALDAGCGTGKLTAQLLRRLPQGKVIALDRSQNMINQAKDFLGKQFLERVSFVKTDLLEPIPEVEIHGQRVGLVKRLSMRRIMARRTKASTVRA